MMKKISFLVLAFLAALLGLRPAAAATFEWGGVVEGRVGYATNPYLNTRSNSGTGVVGVSVAPTLRWRDATSTTELSGAYNRDQYFSRYGHADNFYVDLGRTQQLSSRLSANARVGYLSSISGLLTPAYSGGIGVPSIGSGSDAVGSPTQTIPVVTTAPGVITNAGYVDQLALGTRQEQIYGSAGLNWQPTARDQFFVSAEAQRVNFRHYGGDYTYVGGTAGYLRTLNARTRVGFDVSVGHTFTKAYPDSTSYQPEVTLQRTLSAHWTFNGGVGAIIQSQRRLGRSHTTITPGFNASLCGEYPRLTVCASASRVSAASGIGGLRRQTQFGVDATYRLSERSRILASAYYGISHADEPVVINDIIYGNQRFAVARLSYQRDLSRRLAAGVSGSYQVRTGGGLPDVKALAITFNLTAKFGHLTS